MLSYARIANRLRVARCACALAGMATRPKPRERDEGRRARILADIYAADADALGRQARRHCPGHVDPEDALQNACAEFLRYYDGPPGTDALRYLTAAVKRCAWARGTCAAQRYGSRVELAMTDALQSGRPRVAVLCERPGPLERAARGALVRAAAHGLGELKPDERTALLLLGLGCSYREIAALRGWTKHQGQPLPGRGPRRPAPTPRRR